MTRAAGAGLAAAGLLGCAAPQPAPELAALARADRIVNSFSGATSRGETFEGLSWFSRSTGENRYCVRLKGPSPAGADAEGAPTRATCDGSYTRTQSLLITQRFSCSDGRGGFAQVSRERVEAARLIRSVSMTLRFDDGSTGDARSGASAPLTGPDPCPAFLADE